MLEGIITGIVIAGVSALIAGALKELGRVLVSALIALFTTPAA